VNFALVFKLLFAHLRRNLTRTALTTLAMIAAACVVVWVVSGLDALMGGGFAEENATKYLGRYDAVLLSPGGGISPALVAEVRKDPALAEVAVGVVTRVGVTNVSDPARTASIWDGAPVNGAPPIGPSLVGTDAAEPPYALLSGSWFDTTATNPPQAVMTKGAAERVKANVGDELLVTTMANQETRVKLVGIIDQPAVSPAGGRGAPPPQAAPTAPATGGPSGQGGGPPGGGRGGPNPDAVFDGLLQTYGGSGDTLDYAKIPADERERRDSMAQQRGMPALPTEGTIGRADYKAEFEKRLAARGGGPGGGRGGPGGGRGGRGGGGPGGASGPPTNALFVALDVSNKMTGVTRPPPPSLVSVAFKEGVTAEQFRDTWEKKLSESTPAVNILDVDKVKEQMAGDGAAAGKKAQAYSTTGMALMAAVFIIFTTLSMGVSERARELAVLRAVALTRGQVAMLIAAESILLAFIGWLGGLAAGWGLLALASAAKPDLFPGGASLGWWCVLLTGGAAFGGAIAAAILPAWRATRVSPLEAMAPPRTPPPARWPLWVGLTGLAFLAVNPVVVLLIDVPKESRLWVYPAVGYPCMVIGFALISPMAIVLAEKLLGPLLARVLGLEPKLLATQLTTNLWRTLGTTVALSTGLGLYASFQIWGYSMLVPYFPGRWLPDVLVGFQPYGIPEEEVAKVRSVNGVKADQCEPLAIEQIKFKVAEENQQAAMGNFKVDNVVMVGVDPDRGFGGDHPLIRPEFVSGSRQDAIERMNKGRACLLPDHFARDAKLKVGDTIEFTPPNGPPVTYTVAGTVTLHGWHWMTKFSGVRRNTGRTAALAFTSYTDARNDFLTNKRVQFAWMNTEAGVSTSALTADMKAIAQGQVDDTATHTPAVKVTATEGVRAAITTRADGMIWGFSQIPLITLGVTSIAVIGTVAASVRSRRWSLGVMRAVGVTRFGLVRLILAEAILIGLVVCLLSLAFGVMAGWLGSSMARYGGMFGGMDASLVIPWDKLAVGVGAALGLCLVAAMWPAIRAGRAEPLSLLQAGRAAS
jgi:putative ABC transport system permease protein